MIREIINFTDELFQDIPDIMQWNTQPNPGLHIFIDIDENGKWVNENLEKGKDYDYYDGKNQDITLWDDCIKYQNVSDYITMNKVKKFDSKQKIHSCSPFAVAFNFNFNDTDKSYYKIKKWGKGVRPTEEEKKENLEKIRLARINVINERLEDYKKNSSSVFFKDNDSFNVHINNFFDNIPKVLNRLNELQDFEFIGEKNYVRINLRSLAYESQQLFYENYLKQEILNGEEINKGVFGALGFMNTFAAKKPFLRHQTSFLKKGVSQRFSREEALTLNNFEKLLKRKPKALPNPLPIVVDNREINKQIVKLYNDENKPLNYRDLIQRLFDRVNLKNLSNYYLINYANTQSGIIFNDVDFVSVFRFYLEPHVIVKNFTQSGKVKNKVFELLRDEKIVTVFDFERIVACEIFNNSLVKIKNGKYSTNYFGDIDPQYVSGGDIMYQMIMKYRKAFYDYIYKSKQNALSSTMFEDLMYNSILSSLRKDKIEGRFEWNNSIKKKINIWFSLFNLFTINLNSETMTSNLTELMSKMSNVARGEASLQSSEEFAFGAGQLVSYLMDRSAASDKKYSLLEPYLQKTKSNYLQDAIAQTISVYKHDISVYKGKFERLAAEVLTSDGNVEMKPLLKYFLAGCFSPCVIYEKKN